MISVNDLTTTALFKLLGRRTAYRLGRRLYDRARGEVPNDMHSNGETFLQRCVLHAWKRQQFISDRLVIFDVGANIGNWSTAWLEVLKASEISATTDLYVFEPVPSAMNMLQTRLVSQYVSIHYEQSALSSEDGDGVIYANGNNGTNSLHVDPNHCDARPVAITKFTAASFCRIRGISQIHLMKCDAEGHDMDVILGAILLLKEGRIGVLQFEYNHRWVLSRHFLRDVFSAIEHLPYALAKLQGDHLMIFTEWHHELEHFFEGNYALVRHDALKWFPKRRAQFDRYNALQVCDM